MRSKLFWFIQVRCLFSTFLQLSLCSNVFKQKSEELSSRWQHRRLVYSFSRRLKSDELKNGLKTTPTETFVIVRGVQTQTFLLSKYYSAGRLHSTGVGFLLLIQQPRVQFSAFPKMLLRFIDGAG